MLSDDFEGFLESLLGRKVENLNYFRDAFVHPSFSVRNNYQRLEFLGDAVINLAMTHLLFFKNGILSEGELTKLRMNLVRKEVLAAVSRKLGFRKYLSLGRGEEKDCGREKDSILADVFESFIGAAYLNFGFQFVLDWITERYELFLEEGEHIRDYKSVLQEFLQGKKLGAPRYIVTKEEGLAHNKRFFVELYVGDEKIASGEGKNKKLAEQSAAKLAYQKLLRQDG